MIRQLLIAACSAAMGCGAAAAQEDPRHPAHGFFLAPSVEAQFIELPDHEPIVLRNGNAHLGRVKVGDGDTYGGSLGLGGGVAVGELFGGALWIDFGGQVGRATDEGNLAVGNGANQFRLIPYDGSSNNGFNLGAGPGGAYSFDRETWFYEGEVLARLQFASDGISIEPFFGPHIRVIDDDIDATARRLNNNPNRYTASEDITSSYYGAKLGVDVRGEFSHRAGWTLGGHVGAYYLDGDFDGKQVSTFGGGFATDVSDSDNQFAFAGGLQGGIFLWLAGVRASLTTGVEYLSDIGAVDAAMRPAAGVPAAPAQLDFEDSLSANIGLELSVPLY